MRRGSSNIFTRLVWWLRSGVEINHAPKAESILQRITTKHGNKRENDERNDQKHLSQRSPEFGLAIPVDGKQVNKPVPIG